MEMYGWAEKFFNLHLTLTRRTLSIAFFREEAIRLCRCWYFIDQNQIFKCVTDTAMP